jgi:(R)-3-[(carboxymethyl)amino]fatty acid dioxygenase/decarboxylase
VQSALCAEEEIVMEIREPAKGKIGAEVRLGSRSLELSEDVCRTIKDLVYRHRLVVIPGMALQAREYVSFARNFGTPQVYFQDHYHHPEHPEIFVSSNVPYKGEKFGVSGTGRYWHTDYQFFEQPLPLTMLYPQAFAAQLRETSYIDMSVVLQRLPSALRRRVQGVRAQQDAKLRYKVQACDIDKSIAEILEEVTRLIPPVWHPAIIEHPSTGESILYVSPGFTTALEGLDHETNRAVLADLFEFVMRPEHIHTQYWKEGDILLWDNRSLLHKASSNPSGEPSVSFRIGIYDHLPFYCGLPPVEGVQS